ncbi:transcription elongation factor, mitochondrial [Lampris incognitus]|uniref:transcription elongation factor, mitochondrial n=1 Tax=Lampris incognitus TaxID=2546036 RepID=UPI0024B5B7DC|nr:transcription elongation factor, mitochondrial [Lampris incognitus]
MAMWVARRALSSVIQTGRCAGRSGLFRRPRRSFPELELRYLQCTCCWRSRVPVAGFETLNTALFPSSSPAFSPCSDDGTSLDAYYTLEQRAAILQLLNHATEKELAGVKLLRGRKSVNIVDYRSKNGPFETLESVVKVPRLKHKSAVIVFNAILNPPKKRKRVKIQFAKFIRPVIDRSWLEEATSIVSIVCGTNSIAWAHVSREMTVLDWQELQCPHFLKGKYQASGYLSDITSVLSVMPSADFYIVEKTTLSFQNTSLFPVFAHLRTVEAMLFALLEPRYPQPDCNTPPRVLNMMRLAVGRHFGLIVGESRTSGAETVRQMMTESVTQNLPRLKFPQGLLVKYRSAFQMGKGKGGEELCDALLQGVAFYELLCDTSS